MTKYVLVHGGDISTDTWNEYAKRKDYPSDGKLMGGKVWSGIVSALEKKGHVVFAPTLKDKSCCDLSGHIEQICTLLTSSPWLKPGDS